MKIEKIPTEKLIPYARNAKKHDAAQVSKLAGSIREFGFNNPVLIDKNNGIIAGHGRVMAAQQLGLTDVPCIRLGHSGGMSDAYLDSGTFVKSFYTVMYAPSCSIVSPMGAVNPRLHHKITWRHAVPKILQENLKKNA